MKPRDLFRLKHKSLILISAELIYFIIFMEYSFYILPVIVTRRDGDFDSVSLPNLEASYFPQPVLSLVDVGTRE
jgi:hypothetical protein